MIAGNLSHKDFNWCGSDDSKSPIRPTQASLSDCAAQLLCTNATSFTGPFKPYSSVLSLPTPKTKKARKSSSSEKEKKEKK